MAHRIARPMMTRRMALGLLGSALLPGRHAHATGAAPDSGDVQALVKGNTAFGLNLYGQVASRRGNVFFSPYSISTAFGMTYAGARGATATEMARALQFALPPGRVHAAFGAVVRKVNGRGQKRASELYTANGVWLQRGQGITGDFERVVRDTYGAALERVDFARAEMARQTINAWVERQTQDRIKDLVPEGTLSARTVAVLANAVYFKGAWLRPFVKVSTQPGDFIGGASGTVRNVPFMQQHEEHAYVDGGTFQMLELPYDKSESSMLVFLPRRPDGLADFERTLSAERVTEWLTQRRVTDVQVTLPRFKVTIETRLIPALEQLGMQLAFSERDADFSGMVEGGRRVHVSDVLHKAFVEVDEKGTEATAATANVMTFTSARQRRDTAMFRADHPFFFVIRDNRTDSILFAGRIVDPLAAS